MKLKKKTTRQLSIAVGLLSFAAFIVQGLGSTWGFEEVAKQITQTALLFSGGINIYFLGVTNQKNNADKCFFLKPLNSFCQCGTTGAAFYYFSGLRIMRIFPPPPRFSCHRKTAIFSGGCNIRVTICIVLTKRI